ncbi:hypothetical protein OKW26_002172 [Paraburkholderia sp. 32]
MAVQEWARENGAGERSGILRAKYPLIFDVNPTVADDLDTVPTVFSLWGVECGDGWFDLIDMLCARLQLATKHGAPLWHQRWPLRKSNQSCAKAQPWSGMPEPASFLSKYVLAGSGISSRRT